MEPKKTKMNWVKLLTNESFVGSICLALLGVAAIIVGYKEGAVGAITGIAGMLKNAQGQD